MENYKERFPGIRKIGYLDALTLPPELMQAAIAGANIAVINPITWIPTNGEASIAIEDYYSYGTAEQKVTISLYTRAKIPQSQKLAFVVVCNSGDNYLVGTAEPGYPVVKCERSSGKPNGSAAVTKVSVTHIAPIAAIEIIL